MQKHSETNSAPPELSAAELDKVTGGSTGTGAGRVIFNPYSITRKFDKASSL